MRKQRGAVILEFAVVLPVFLFLIMAGADFLWFEHQAVSLSYIATQAAVCQKQGCDASTFSKDAAGGLLLDPQHLTVTTNGNAVTLTYQAHALTGFLHPIILTRTATTP